MRLPTLLLHYSLLALSFAFSQQGFSQPQRIVSLNLCTDLLLLELSDRENIASLSYLAADPQYSYLAHEVKDIPLNRGQAEEVLRLNPDLIVSSQFSATMAVSLLRQLDHQVSVFGFPANLEEIYAQIRQLATLIAEPERGEKLISNMQSGISEALSQTSLKHTNKVAVFYSNNGYSYGNQTLRNNFLETLNLRNLAAEAGIFGPGLLSIEALIIGEPDYLLVDSNREHDDKLAHPMLEHPALKHTFSPESIITIPDTLFQCAGPSLVEAFQIMAEKANTP